MDDQFNERPFHGLLRAMGRGAVETLLVTTAVGAGLTSFAVSLRQQRKNRYISNFRALKNSAGPAKKAAAAVLKHRPTIHRWMRLED